MHKITVRDYMTPNPVVFTSDMPVLDAVHALVTNRISGAPVIDDHGELVGVLSERDCVGLVLEAGYYGSTRGPVSRFMSTGVQTVDASLDIISLAQQFQQQPYRRYPVTSNNELVGIISRRDILRALLEP
ncbi:MAG: CBS domain-containing protein [Pseudomonadota bacterium]